MIALVSTIIHAVLLLLLAYGIDFEIVVEHGAAVTPPRADAMGGNQILRGNGRDAVRDSTRRRIRTLVFRPNVRAAAFRRWSSERRATP